MAASDIVRIELPTPFRVGTVNTYLLAGGAPLTLVDTGPRFEPSISALEEALGEHGYRVEDVELLILTHQHCDHVGLAQTIRERSGATIAGIPRLRDYMASYESSVAAEDDFAVGVMRRYGTQEERIDAIYGVSRSFWKYGESAAVDLDLEDGGTVEAGGRTWRVARRPGHSPTDTVLVDESEGVALTGDHLLGRISSNPVIHRPLSGSMLPEERDHTLELYLHSLRRTRELGLSEILPGHGSPNADPSALVDLRLRQHAERKETIAGLIAKGRHTVDTIAEQLWGEVERSQIYLAVSEVVGHTDLLIAEGRLREDDSGDGSVIFESIAAAA
jgi:glyoxylase-like metal-dependent hydrolase (beta-lactamase superfamily II)